MNKLQSNLYQLLQEIDVICKQHGIQYFLAGGTALGTVRNHCFLPWDDDIDLYITRDNWNKLKKLLEEKKIVLPQERSFSYAESTEYYCNPIPRYTDHSTTAIYKSQALAAKACGQHIEFLIMDPMPVDEEKQEQYKTLLKVYTELMSPYFVVNKNLSIADFKQHYRLYNRYYWKSKLLGRERVIKQLEKWLLQFSDEECDTYCMRWGINILMYKKEHFGQGRLERFETESFPVGEHAEGIFRVAYGDSWMYVPENDEQVVHNALQDLDIPFHEYTDNYMPCVNRKRVFRAFRRNKKSSMKAFVHRRLVEKNEAEIKAHLFEQENAFVLCSRIEELNALLQKKDYEQLNAILQPYYTLQLNCNVRKYGVQAKIDDEVLYVAMMNYIEQGRYYVANNLLKMRKISEEPLTENILMAEKMINVCRELSVLIYDLKNYDKLQEVLEIYEKEFPEQIDVFRSKLWLMDKKAGSDEEWERIVSLAKSALELYPFDGEIMAFLAHAQLELGEKERAMETYKEAVTQTRNGIIWEKVNVESGISRINDNI